MRFPQAPYIRSALGAFTVGIVMTVIAFVRAVYVAPVSVAPLTADPASVSPMLLPAVPGVDIEAVGNNDIFQPDRSSMPVRFRMPGDAPLNYGDARLEPDKPAVLGTVVATDGQNYATCQLLNGRPTIVHVGDVLGGYKVMSIDRSKVVFKAPSGAQIEVSPL
jgi:type IV pilus biogenesis protein PilP